MDSEPPENIPKQQTSQVSRKSIGWRVPVLIMGVVAILAVSIQYGDQLSVRNLANYEQQLRDQKTNSPALVYAVAFAVYCLITGASLPGASALTLFCGWYFGFWRGLVFVSFASTTGATLAFLISRHLLRESLAHRFSSRLEAFDSALAEEGPFYLFSLRLIPAVPFFVINAVMGLTRMPIRTFWWVSQLGMLPGTAAYVYVGSQFPTLKELGKKQAIGIISPQLVIAFVLLGLLPIATRWIVKSLRKKKRTESR